MYPDGDPQKAVDGVMEAKSPEGYSNFRPVDPSRLSATAEHVKLISKSDPTSSPEYGTVTPANNTFVFTHDL